jgi:hypothetical protein
MTQIASCTETKNNLLQELRDNKSRYEEEKKTEEEVMGKIQSRIREK